MSSYETDIFSSVEAQVLRAIQLSCCIMKHVRVCCAIRHGVNPPSHLIPGSCVVGVVVVSVGIFRFRTKLWQARSCAHLLGLVFVAVNSRGTIMYVFSEWSGALET